VPIVSDELIVHPVDADVPIPSEVLEPLFVEVDMPPPRVLTWVAVVASVDAVEPLIALVSTVLFVVLWLLVLLWLVVLLLLHPDESVPVWAQPIVFAVLFESDPPVVLA
jgi:hypothetical protein